jgi:glycerol-3-phosphate acyltransferase PlsY
MEFDELVVILLACLVSYIFGALPIAKTLSTRKGIDIFSTGTGLAGASNVFKNVGRGSALLVLVFDVAKGSLAVIVSAMMGVEGVLLFIPAMIAVFGHWNSVFTRFKGGDGMAIGAGIAIGVFGLFAVVAFIVAALVGLVAQKLPFSSLFSMVAGYGTLYSLTASSNEQREMAIGFGLVTITILIHAVLGHRRRNRAADRLS